MKVNCFWICLFLANTIVLSAQNSKSKFGIQTGNNLSFPGENSAPHFNEGFLLRYSIGFIGRQVLKENIRFQLIAPVRKGELSLDYGLNLVFKGYDYQLESVNAFRDEITLEVPVQFFLQDKRNVFLPRKWHQKGIGSFARIGFKGIYRLNKGNTKVELKSSERLTENLSEKKFNFISKMGGGIIKNHKNGNITMFEIVMNLGWFANKSGTISYENSDTQVLREISFSDNGSYLSLNMVYLFDWQRFKKKKNKSELPVIFCPRF